MDFWKGMIMVFIINRGQADCWIKVIWIRFLLLCANAIIEIVTNKEATNGRTITVGNQKVRIKKSAVTVSDSNADFLQLLDGIGQAEKYTERTMI